VVLSKKKKVQGQLYLFLPFAHWIGSWMDRRTGLDAVAKQKKKSPIIAPAGN
jgi:hypothetical protein